MSQPSTQPLTDQERRYLEVLEAPSSYPNPKWHDPEYMTAALGITEQEMHQIVKSLLKKRYLKWVAEPFWYTRSRKPLPHSSGEHEA